MALAQNRIRAAALAEARAALDSATPLLDKSKPADLWPLHRLEAEWLAAGGKTADAARQLEGLYNEQRARLSGNHPELLETISSWLRVAQMQKDERTVARLTAARQAVME